METKKIRNLNLNINLGNRLSNNKKIKTKKENKPVIILNKKIGSLNINLGNKLPNKVKKAKNEINKKVRIRQSHYKSNQPLDLDAVPYPTLGYEPILYENQHIMDLIEKNDHEGYDYWGLTSWRMYEKTKLTVKEINFFMESDNFSHDVYIYFRLNDNKFNIVKTRPFHGATKIIKRLFESNIIPFENPKFDWTNNFCNFWIAKPKVINEYYPLLKKVSDFITSGLDPVINKLLDEEFFFHNKKKRKLHPFVLEYLFGFFLQNNKDITYKVIPNVLNSELSNMYKDIRGNKENIFNYDKLLTPYRNKPFSFLFIDGERDLLPNFLIRYFPYSKNDYITRVSPENIQIVKHNNIIIDRSNRNSLEMIKDLKKMWDTSKECFMLISSCKNKSNELYLFSEVFGKPDIIYNEDNLKNVNSLLVWKRKELDEKSLISILQKRLETSNNVKKNKVNMADIKNTISYKRTFELTCLELTPLVAKGPFPSIKEKFKNKTVLVEPRETEHLEFLIKNTVMKMGNNWGHIIYCSNKNYFHVKTICVEISDEIEIRILAESFKTIDDYNKLLMSVEFWESLNCEKVLIYQTDTFIINDFNNEFLKFDYIGATFGYAEHVKSIRKRTNLRHISLVGNGGLSLRSTKAMITALKDEEAIYKFQKEEFCNCKDLLAEDVFFSSYLFNNGFKVANPFEGDEFCINISYKHKEEIKIEDNPFALHKPELYFDHKTRLISPSGFTLNEYLKYVFFRKISNDVVKRKEEFNKKQNKIKFYKNKVKKKQPIKVSVIVRLYNYERFIKYCLESVFKNTLKEIEVIVVDDCSTDNSLKTTLKLIKKEKEIPVTVIKKPVNVFHVHTANLGASYAKGEFLYFLDADDEVSEDCFKALYEEAKQNDADVCYGKVELLNEYEYHLKYYSDKPLDKGRLINEGNYITIMALICSKTFKAIGGFDETLQCWLDYDLWLRLMHSNHKFHFVDKVTSFYNKHTSSVTAVSTIKQNLLIEDFNQNRYCNIRKHKEELVIADNIFRVSNFKRYESNEEGDMSSILLYQLYFKETQKDKLDDFTKHYKTEREDRPVLFENKYITDFIKNNKHKDCSYFGVTSWRQKLKTHLEIKDIKLFIASDNFEAEAYLYYSVRDNLKLPHAGEEIKTVLNYLHDTNIIPFDMPKYEDVPTCFSNYWIAKPEIVDRYYAFLTPILDSFFNDKFLIDWFKNHKFFYRNKTYNLYTFVIEYIFPLFLFHYKINFTIIPDKNQAGDLEEIFKRTSGGDIGHSDKGSTHNYLGSYNRLFTPYRNKKINILEIGVFEGQSLKMWKEYFPNANIYGIDIKNIKQNEDRITTAFCDQSKAEELDKVFEGKTFDIIIDDGSHRIEHQLISLKALWKRLNKNGLYVIEDIQNPETDVPRLAEVRNPERVIDTRKTKSRYDDLLIIWRKQ